MKHGRRHDVLKEQEYKKRKDAEGYGRPYRAMPMADPSAPHRRPAPAPEVEGVALGSLLGGRARRDLKRLGIDPSRTMVGGDDVSQG